MDLSFNQIVGQKLRVLRQENGLSQAKVAEALGVSFQQVQKYESGANAISIESLKKFSDFTNTPFTYFLQGTPKEKPATGRNHITLAIIKELNGFNSCKQKAVLDMVRSIKNL